MSIHSKLWSRQSAIRPSSAAHFTHSLLRFLPLLQYGTSRGVFSKWYPTAANQDQVQIFVSFRCCKSSCSLGAGTAGQPVLHPLSAVPVEEVRYRAASHVQPAALMNAVLESRVKQDKGDHGGAPHQPRSAQAQHAPFYLPLSSKSLCVGLLLPRVEARIRPKSARAGPWHTTGLSSMGELSAHGRGATAPATWIASPHRRRAASTSVGRLRVDLLPADALQLGILNVLAVPVPEHRVHGLAILATRAQVASARVAPASAARASRARLCQTSAIARWRAHLLGFSRRLAL